MYVDACSMPHGSTYVNVDGRLDGMPTATARRELPLLETGSLPCCAPITGRTLTAGEAVELAAVLKAVADPARLRLLSLIQAHEGGEACVCDLTEPVGLSQPTVSHHLKVLFDAGLVSREKRGAWTYYLALPARLADLAAALTGSRAA
jgi:ArsR family transcriptional regulator, arsenate/arsenite/antimonite-responsive transcriptional repressor